jgi:hypothetical protein
MVARPKPKRMYRTMQGRMVDIEKLRAANESTLAVGNMNVNARGDVLGVGGQIVTPKAKVMQQYYEQPKGVVDDTPSKNKIIPAVEKAPKASPIQKMTPVAKTETTTTTAFKPKVQAVKTEAVKTEPVAVKSVETVKPLTAKKGIDAALDGLE